MYRETNTDDYYQQIWVAEQTPQWNNKQADFYIPRCGQFHGYGRYKMNYLSPYIFCYLFIEGETSINIDGRDYIGRSGDLLFVFEGQHKKLQESPEAPLKNFHIDLQGTAVEAILNSMNIRRGQQFFQGHFYEKLQHLVTEITLELAKPHVDVLKQSMLSWRLLEGIHRELPQIDKPLDDPSERIRLLIQRDFRFSLSIEEIADKLGVSRSTIFRQFKKKYGLSPKQYLEELRLAFASEQLSIRNISISEVAFNSGYNSVNHFIRMFKKRYEQTPFQYQKGLS